MSLTREEKLALLRARLEKQARVAPVTSLQRQLWFLDRLLPGNPVYNMAGGMRMRGPLDDIALVSAFEDLTQRHEILRTTFEERDGHPVQVIHGRADVSLPRLDLSDRPDAEQEALAHAVQLSGMPLDLTRGPLWRAELVRLGASVHLLVIIFHHIISDGWGNSIFARDLAALYATRSGLASAPLPPMSLQLADYARWEQERLQSNLLDGQIQYWREHLAGAPRVLALPTDRPRGDAQRFRGAKHYFTVDAALTSALKAAARQASATLFMMLLAGYATLLHQLSGQDDLVIATPMINRRRVELEPLIGPLVNTLPLRISLTGRPTFRALVDRVREVHLGAWTNPDVPLTRLLSELRVERDPRHNPLFQTLFVLHNTPPPAVQVGPLQLEPVNVDNGTARFDLSLTAVPRPDGALRAWLEYDASLFDAATVARQAEQFVALLRAATQRPDAHLDDLAAAAGLEQPDRRANALLAGIIAGAAAQPDTIAVIDGFASLSFQALQHAVERTAAMLQESGLGPGATIAICITPSLESTVATLAVLRLGARHCPMDPAWPAARIATLCEQIRPDLVLVPPAHPIPAGLASWPTRAIEPAVKDAARIGAVHGAMPAPQHAPGDEHHDPAPATDAEQILSALWREVLHLDEVAPGDNFFAIGGDSIIALQVIARAREHGLKLSAEQFFQHQTLSALARVARPVALRRSSVEADAGTVPLGPVQRWFFDLPLRERDHWNQAVLLEPPASHVDRAARARPGCRGRAPCVPASALPPAGRRLGARNRRASPAAPRRTGGAGRGAGDRDPGRSWPRAAFAVADRWPARTRCPLRRERGAWQRAAARDPSPRRGRRLVAHPARRPRPRARPPGARSARRGAHLVPGMGRSARATCAEPDAARPGAVLDRHAVVAARAAAWRRRRDLPGAGCARGDQHARPADHRGLAQAVRCGLWHASRRALARGRGQSGRGMDRARTGRDRCRGARPGQPVRRSRPVTDGGLVHVDLSPGAARQPEPAAGRRHQGGQGTPPPRAGRRPGLPGRPPSRPRGHPGGLGRLPAREICFNFLGQTARLPAGVPFRGSDMDVGPSRGAANPCTYRLMFGAAVRDDRLVLSLTHDGHAYDQATAQGLVARTLAELRGMVTLCTSAHGQDHTPADFPAAKLSQGQLDTLLRKIGRSSS